MITISKASGRELKDFSIREWHLLDIEHYGKRVEWNHKKFRFKALHGKELAGYISGNHVSGIVYVDEIIVARDKRGQGIGKALIETAINFGKKFKAHKIHLITGKSWQAKHFYEKLGFKQVGELPEHHFKKDFVIYQKSI
jgi:ribosomal protein S18 acetylase RimI-like enzyme